MSSRPIIIVTGANSGVGFGICHRLLIQLSSSAPPDARPQFVPLTTSSTPSWSVNASACDGLSLILACRSEKRALEAREKLLDLLDEHILRQRRRPGYDGHADLFRDNLEINFHQIDMSDERTVFRFTRDISQRYPYISHLICNAGLGTFTGIDWVKAIKQVLTHPVVAVTVTEFKKQSPGHLSPDGFGLVWQCNVFSHYVLTRRLETLFKSYHQLHSQPARVLWMSSLEAASNAFYRDDWQCIDVPRPYEATKYQIDLIASRLAIQSAEGQDPVVRHLLVHPGIAESNMSKSMIGNVLEYIKLAAFYIARWFGSPHHTITAFNAAVAAVHFCLVALVFVPTRLMTYRHVSSAEPIYYDCLHSNNLYPTGIQSAEEAREAEESGKPPSLKFGSTTDRMGRTGVGVQTVVDWAQHEEDAEFLMDKCETLYQSLIKLHEGERSKR
ncbi:hypothetical protein K474DRAFT_1658817 [Panus rudis PR-1116 ss-1]|nr:hypothetical protein K474DRAFT_1658817 [Panus rudis PR-1116 ss-1]